MQPLKGLTVVTLEHLGGFGMLHVEREAFLGAVGPDEVRREALHAGVVAAREVAGAGAFDLDDPGAEVGQLARRERRGNGVFERDDSESLEWLHVRLPAASRPHPS